ncbi:MAG: nitrilase-related carbon-nitrogen hydrolase [Xenococcaceae cyanobacterium MO_167.B27]|nr:nitrilase-related carbon-nitrogen hydrolase [Xenococcaceae cyanobacterium MO_167.B27]
MGDVFPTIKAAVVQAASVLYDREQTLDKAVALIEEAARQGAELVAFAESLSISARRWRLVCHYCSWW